MGLFDFFKKKRTPQTPSEIPQNTTKPTELEPIEAVLASSHQQTINNTPYITTLQGPEAPQPLNELLETAIPSRQGLYPHEILMLEYAPHFKTSDNSFQNFWYWQYSVTDPQSVLNSLFERGFINVGNLRSAIEHLKLPEIKDNLRQINQKVSGKKAELVERLLEFGDHSSLSQKYPERYYVLTASGEQELKENQYVAYLHRQRYMSVWEMNRRIAQTHYSYRDILWGYFNEQSGIHFSDYDFGLYRCTRLDMYQFLMEENKTKTAFALLCEVVLYDLNGLDNGEKILFEWETSQPKHYLDIWESKLKRFFPYKKEAWNIAPGVSAWLSEMQTLFGLDDTDYRMKLLDEFSQIPLPHRFFTNEECADIVIADFHDDMVALTAIYQEAENRERKRLNTIRNTLR